MTDEAPTARSQAEKIVKDYVRMSVRGKNMGFYPVTFYADELVDAIEAALIAAGQDGLDALRRPA